MQHGIQALSRAVKEWDEFQLQFPQGLFADLFLGLFHTILSPSHPICPHFNSFRRSIGSLNALCPTVGSCHYIVEAEEAPNTAAVGASKYTFQEVHLNRIFIATDTR